jgi:hypothetical protein
MRSRANRRHRIAKPPAAHHRRGDTTASRDHPRLAASLDLDAGVRAPRLHQFLGDLGYRGAAAGEETAGPERHLFPDDTLRPGNGTTTERDLSAALALRLSASFR